MKLVDCTHDRHARPILDILNDAIVTSTALYDYTPRPIESMEGWFAAKRKGSYPVIGLEDEDGSLLGFASYGPFRAWPAYKYTVENGVYVRKDHRGQGLGHVLLHRTIEVATGQDYHLIVAGIDTRNAASIRLHESAGFTHAGTIPHAGFKFDRWLDLDFYTLKLDTPSDPVDGIHRGTP
ncbi:MAG: N-acetyltransferase family protein [Pseudomonadota bacterium]